jgi:hypothetical protein
MPGCGKRPQPASPEDWPVGPATSARDVILIVAAWSVLIATMLALQVAGLDFGFDIWPFGEFRNWIQLLQDGPGLAAAKLFWLLDYRNVLAPWWYIAARPLIDAVPAAPLILQLLAQLFVGILAYLLMTELTRSRAFGLSLGILTALFIVNVHRDNITWTSTVALGFALLAVLLFALFCKDRTRSPLLVSSLLAWFVAIGTYTIQVGAIAAVVLVSLRQAHRVLGLSWRRAIVCATVDVLPYAALFILYMIIWDTTVPMDISARFPSRFSFDALAQTTAFALWNVHYHYFWSWLIYANALLMAALFAVLALVMFAMLRATSSIRGVGFVRPRPGALGFVVLIGLSLITPTITLEATSAIFVPGSRWPMVMPFWSPFLICVVAFIALSFARSDRLWFRLWRSWSACAAAFVMVLALGFNHTQVIHARNERQFFSQLQAIVAQDHARGAKFPHRYAVQLAEPAPFVPSGRLREVYTRTIIGPDVALEIVDASPTGPWGVGETYLIWKQGRLSRTVNDAAATIDEGKSMTNRAADE